jgi:phosphoribosyl 1,2-cyclic phosphate phosphodiesterase
VKVTILGCGSAPGVPQVSRGWGACDPSNPRNRRRRSSILVERGETSVLVDTTPDLREQMIDNNIKRLDAVLYTHDHADHVHGIDELREINRAMGCHLDVHAKAVHMEVIRRRFDYVFQEVDDTKYTLYKPTLVPRLIEGPFTVGALDIVPFEQDHGYSMTTGFRFGNFAYSTDVVDFPEASWPYLEGLDLWIVSCLMDHPHQTHAHYDKVLGWVERLKPKRTVLTHMGLRMDYDTLRAKLPPHIEPAYDGMVIELSS